MENILSYLEKSTMIVSNVVWPIFIPFLLLVGIYICAQVILNIRSLTTIKSKLNLKYIVPQSSVALGAMMGTGTIIGFLSALSNLAISGQIYVEAVAMWALLGSIVLIPISYCESLIAKVVGMEPKDYIKSFVSKSASKTYIVAIILLYVFAIGGVQFSGIEAIMITTLNKVFNIELNEMQRYLYIVIPLIGIITIIVLKNRQDIFIKSMIGMILVAVVIYFIFFGLFATKTSHYIPIFIERVMIGFKNPISMILGIPLGLIFGMQRVIQIAEPGLGTLALASMKSDSSPRVAGTISLILTTTLVVVSIVVTSYIASYGLNAGIITFSEVGVQRLVSYFETVISVTGGFGFTILFIFIILSGMTTLLGSYILLNNLIERETYKKNIMYISLLIVAGALAIFKFDVLFNLLNILLFIATSLNITALAMFTEFEWSKYKINCYSSKNTRKKIA
ncbi:MAG: hypothetical protein RR942_07300 [Romboutsia sp.]